MNNLKSKEILKDLLISLENLENSYNPSSNLYRFTKVFYNIVDSQIEKPYNFPIDLWEKYYIPGSQLMPVILNKQQIDERKKIQNELIAKLAESKSGIIKKLENLKFKREMVKSKLKNTINKFRNKTRKYVFCEEINCKIQTDIIEREKFAIKEKKEEVLKILAKIREKLERFEKDVSEYIHVSENGISMIRKYN